MLSECLRLGSLARAQKLQWLQICRILSCRHMPVLPKLSAELVASLRLIGATAARGPVYVHCGFVMNLATGLDHDC